MSRLKSCFETLKQNNKKALIPFVTAGDPQPGITVPLMHSMVEAGANVLELGIPFSDPMAEGPVIQAACERALEHHVTLDDVLAMVGEFRIRDSETPVVLMGYLNPVEVMGYETFAERASQAGVDGIILVDLPLEEGEALIAALKARELDMIFLLSPTSTDERIGTITAIASGFVYYVSLKGVTGAANLDVGSVQQKLQQIRSHTDLPVGVGFGIRDADTARQIAAVADAVVVGSAVVQRVADNVDDAEKITWDITALLASMRKAMDE